MTKVPRQTSIRPLLVTQFFGAFNDNAWKLIVIVLMGRLLGRGEAAAQMQARDALVAFTLPLILFSLPAAMLADRFSKRTLIIATKVLETALMAAGAVLLFLMPDQTTPLLFVLGGMGLQSALFSPAKYAIVPELVSHDRLSRVNGTLSLGTMIAIIAGTALGSLALDWSGDVTWAAAAALAVLGVVGIGAAIRIPAVKAAATGTSSVATLGQAWRSIRKDRVLWMTVLGQTWFWCVVSLLGQNLIDPPVVTGRSLHQRFGLAVARLHQPLRDVEHDVDEGPDR